MPVSPARAAAFDILLRVDLHAAYATELLRASQYKSLSPDDHGLATELVMGVLRWQSALDAQLSEVSSSPLEKLDREVLIALRLGAYQLGWLDRIPARAAIHESVELVKRARKRSAASFANAVLRKLPVRTNDHASHDELIQTSQDVSQLAASGAHPLWLVEKWTRQFGLAATRQICSYDQQVPGTSMRLRDAAAEEDLRNEGVALSPGDFLSSSRRVVSGDITHTKVFDANRIAIQDEASQLAAALVGHGSRILDGCAAPGGKTQAIADRNPESRILAVELHPHRAAALRTRVAAANVEVRTGDLQQLPVGELFDRVLVDVPCSGTGTLARHPEIKWRLQAADLEDLPARQTAILRAAMRHVAPKGRLIYSTCSLEEEEDEAVVERALAAGSFRPVDCRTELDRLREEGEWLASEVDSFLRGPYLRTIPGIHRCDGFFVSILEKN